MCRISSGDPYLVDSQGPRQVLARSSRGLWRRQLQLQRMQRSPAGVHPAREIVTERVHLQDVVSAEAALEHKVHPGYGRVEAPGRLGAVVEGVEPRPGRDCGPTPGKIASPAAQVQVRHRLRTEPED